LLVDESVYVFLHVFFCCFQPRRCPGPRFSFVLLSFSLVLFYFFFYFVSLFGLFAFNSSPQTDPGGGNVSR
jgi:hypothetical protein